LPPQLTEESIQQFRNDGFLCPLPAFGPEEIGERLSWLEGLEQKRAGRLPPAMNAKPHLLIPWLWEMVHDARIVDVIESLLGPDILCWGTSFISKRPGDSRYVSWHQDATYWGLSSPQAVTAWIAFTPSIRDNGCVRVIPGSHQAQLPHADTHDSHNLLGRREEVIAGIDETKAVDLILKPGQMSVHDVLIIHGSEPNRSAIRRVGFAIRFIPGHVHQLGGECNSATLVRGQNSGHFDLEIEPEGEFHPVAVARHALALRRGMNVIFSGAKRA
jgi:non-heme Fe2+,alpha-ketoglutarate-dependent halogenase